MFERRFGDHAKSGSVGSSQGSIWRERRQKRCEDREREREEEQSGLEKGSYQTLRMVLGAMGHEQLEESDREVERLRRLVRDFKFEARNRRQRRDQDNQERRDDNVGDRDGGEFNQSSSHQRRDRSRESRQRRTRSHSQGPH